MSTFSSLGVGSGIDLQSMLTKLMAVERAPIDALNARIATTNSKISSYGTLKSKLDALSSAADTFRFPSRLSALKATSSNENALKASASFIAAPGSYTVEVVDLATQQKSNTAGYTAGTTFTPGTITLTVGDPSGSPTDHVIDLSGGTSHSLNDIRNAINSANAGVKANLVTASDGKQYLTLTSVDSGVAGTFSLATTMSTSGGQPSLATLTPYTTASDALIKVDGIDVKSSTNEFSGVVAGLSFTAKAAGTTTVTVATDAGQIESSVKTFVEAYNAVVDYIKTNSDYDLDTRKADVFNGDSVARTVLSSLANARSTIPGDLASAPLKNLFEIGVSVDRSGKLTFDATKLKTAVAASPDDVVALVKSYGTSFSNMVANLQAASGNVTNKVSGLQNLIESYTKQKETLEIRVANIEKGYRRQFSALDRMVSSMQQTSSYLSQQLAGLSRSS